MIQKFKHTNFEQQSLLFLITKMKKKKSLTIIDMVKKKIQPDPENSIFLGISFKTNFRKIFESGIYVMEKFCESLPGLRLKFFGVKKR